jgi:DNA mismatch repair protein MutS
MIFTTDKQTLEDLNIFGRQGSDSVYTIFNRTTTRGGASILEEMFHYPLSDEQAINRRSGIIQYFAALGIPFPFQSSHFDAVEPYLSNTDERTKLSAGDQSPGRKLSNLVAVDAETAVIYKGVTSLTELLKGLSDFIKSLDGRQGSASGHFYQSDKEAIAALLAEPAFAPVLKVDIKGKLPHATIAEYDVLFRFLHRNTIQKLLRHIYYLDVYLSVARVALERKLVFPTALPGHRHTLLLEGVYHLQLKKAIPNTVKITPESNVLFLTGANMAGKSTFMKSLGIALFLAHMGFPVAAASMEFSVLDGIYTTINLPDNLGMGASHFYAEVLRVRKVARELSLGKNLFIIFDELFRGTNVKDAYEATIAITAGFAAKRNSMFVISTHIIEAGDVLRERCPTVNFVYLPTHMSGNTPVYTYTLETGITADRHGMVIINNEGILDILEHGRPKQEKSTRK